MQLCIAQPLKPGDKVPDVSLTHLLNSTERAVTLSTLKGKVVILDFWATWCTPCIKGFSKLAAIQKKFGSKVQIIAISDETPERLERFLKYRPVNFWIASDSARSLQKWFPHVSIPHVVVISPQGMVQAITYGDELNEAVVSRALKGSALAVSLKEEKTEKNAAFAEVQPGEEFFGMKGFQKDVRGGKNVTGNSIMYSNMHFSHFFLDAYGVSFNRLRYRNIENAEQKYSNENRYSLYIAIRENSREKLLATLREKLGHEFAFRAKIEKETDTVHVIRRIGKADTSVIKPARSTTASGFNKGRYSARDIAIGPAMAEYLENFGIVEGVVLDESGDVEAYDIHFTWEPEKSGSVDEFLNRLGLKLEKAVREYEVLVIYK
jgi:peroxiredoxin